MQNASLLFFQPDCVSKASIKAFCMQRRQHKSWNISYERKEKDSPAEWLGSKEAALAKLFLAFLTRNCHTIQHILELEN